jgi:hypothetical protein
LIEVEGFFKEFGKLLDFLKLLFYGLFLFEVFTIPKIFLFTVYIGIVKLLKRKLFKIQLLAIKYVSVQNFRRSTMPLPSGSVYVRYY